MGNSLFDVVKLTSNVDPDKYSYSGCGTRFDSRGIFSLPDCKGLGKNVIIFGVDDSSSAHVDYRLKDISVLGMSLMHGLDDTTLTAGTKLILMIRKRSFA